MKTFFQSEHCLSKVHCKTCQDTGAVGLNFRAAIRATFGELGTPDLACQVAFLAGTPVQPKKIIVTPFTRLARGISSLPESGTNHALKAMTAQLQELVRERREGSCHDRLNYKRRIEAKIALMCMSNGPVELHELAKPVLSAWRKSHNSIPPAPKLETLTAS